MPIPLPRLDDRTFADLTAEARASLPALSPAWTDHNPSDPGIALIELFAWLTEALIYQVDQVPDAHVAKFLALLGAPPEPGADLAVATRAAVLGLRERYRAVTPLDHEALVTAAWPALTRVRCVPGRDLTAADRAARATEAPATVSLVVVPPHPDTGDPTLADVAAFLEPRRLLTTHLHVVGPRYLPVTVAADLIVRDDAVAAVVLADARAAVAAFLDPHTGGPDATGWPFGRPVWVSEVTAVLTAVPLVDDVVDLAVGTGDPARVLRDDAAAPTGVALDVDELVTVTTDGLTAWGADGVRRG